MQFPVNLNIAGRPCLLVGGGRIALRKAQQLLACGADLTVLAPDILPDFFDLGVRTVERAYQHGDLAAYRLVVTATGNVEVDQQIFNEAEALGIWVNSADDPDRCSFTLPAVLRQGSVMVTVSTGGASPALSSWLRRELEELIGPEFAEIAAVLAAKRAQVHAEGASTEDIDWKPIIEEVIATHGVQSLSRREMEVAR
jgi:precorrin-2 dehydrogenase/sirohydrochlorin ferrochelatase